MQGMGGGAVMPDQSHVKTRDRHRGIKHPDLSGTALCNPAGHKGDHIAARDDFGDDKKTRRRQGNIAFATKCRQGIIRWPLKAAAFGGYNHMVKRTKAVEVKRTADCRMIASGDGDIFLAIDFTHPKRFWRCFRG